MQRNNTDQEQLLKEITSLLRKTRVPYMITGSVSVIFYGRPRASHDIDFVVEAKKEDTQRMKKAFALLPHSEFLVDEQSIEDAIMGEYYFFNVLHLPTMLKLDFWLLKNDPFDQERFWRRRSVKVFGQTMTFASPEDTILIKLLCYKESNIEKHLIDAAFVYQIQRENLDWAYLKSWAKKQGTAKMLKELAKIDLEKYY